MLKHKRWVVASLAAVVAIAVTLSVVGVEAQAGASSSHSRSTAPPPPDHFLCYIATPTTATKTFKFPPLVVLKNQFTAHDGTKLKPGLSLSQLLHCNPVEKIVGSTVTPITNPNAHLVCFRFTAPTQPVHMVQVTNQFSQPGVPSPILDTGQPSRLCLPTWKSLTGPPRMKPNQPPGLDHFTCYPVTYDPNTPSRYVPPGPVSLQDQFATSPVAVQVGDPQLLCLPTTKIVTSAAGVRTVYKANNPAAHLLCFSVTQTPFPPSVWDENQFGTSQINLDGTAVLCLPSTKVLLH